ncbi:hypothetical protein F3Y22_tig00110788pilonHSYRG00010 [Hibiscus syriacus]|uniref:Uncharacterized protein n=1 Tax=Hibiscus syriacus TaxID=106335 RepID=A0A6A2ZPC5_HIBSY|nr:hypothetical protein F3Y22_tig00110788pilonHSYRG00010 [Hibiscus syriacus]
MSLDIGTDVAGESDRWRWNELRFRDLVYDFSVIYSKFQCCDLQILVAIYGLSLRFTDSRCDLRIIVAIYGYALRYTETHCDLRIHVAIYGYALRFMCSRCDFHIRVAILENRNANLTIALRFSRIALRFWTLICDSGDRVAIFISRCDFDNENLKINEATTVDNIRDLKLLCDASCEAHDPERVKKQKVAANSADKDHKDHKEQQGKKSKHNRSKYACLNLSFPNYKNKDANDDSKIPQRVSYGDSDSNFSDDPLKGSIFYTTVKSPKTPSTSSSNHQRKKSSLTDDEAMNGDEFEPVDTSNFALRIR